MTEEQYAAMVLEYEQNEQDQYANKSKAERQKLGQFFTPPNTTKQMIDKFSSKMLENDDYIDPTCGNGNLLAGLIFAGVSPDRVYGIELDPAIHALAVERLGKLGVPSDHIILGSALDELVWQKIKSSALNGISNPPYGGLTYRIITVLKKHCNYIVMLSRGAINRKPNRKLNDMDYCLSYEAIANDFEDVICRGRLAITTHDKTRVPFDFMSLLGPVGKSIFNKLVIEWKGEHLHNYLAWYSPDSVPNGCTKVIQYARHIACKTKAKHNYGWHVLCEQEKAKAYLNSNAILWIKNAIRSHAWISHICDCIPISSDFTLDTLYKEANLTEQEIEWLSNVDPECSNT